jgi:hypothetical protein
MSRQAFHGAVSFVLLAEPAEMIVVRKQKGQGPENNSRLPVLPLVDVKGGLFFR